MDRFLSIEAFVRVAETGSFAEAARQLGVANSVVTTRVQQLEQFIDAPLFHRTTRHVRLSEVGETFYKECSELVSHVGELTDQMRQMRAAPSGKMRVQMLPGFALKHFGPILAEFTQKYPNILIDVIVNDRVVDPIEEGFDVAFQIFPPLSESLVERGLFPVRRLFCATPAYIERHGAPRTPHELQAHTTALYAGYPSRNRWTFEQGDQHIDLDLPGQVRSNSVHLLRDYALGGTGVVCLPTLVASEDLVAGRLVPVLCEYTLTHFVFAAVFPATQRQTLKVRLLIDFIAERLGGVPYWDQPLIERGWVR